MIKVDLQPKPTDFDSKVKKPGQDFLKTIPRPRGKQWNNKEYWRKAISDMTTAYNSICAYSSFWIKSQQQTIDHYISRDENPKLAYEWGNFRLASWRINTSKRNNKDVLDPFKIGENWFILDFITFEVKPNPELSATEIESIRKTIKQLKLNHNDYIEFRETWFNIIKNDFSLFAKKAPHIAQEMKRQNII